MPLSDQRSNQQVPACDQEQSPYYWAKKAQQLLFCTPPLTRLYHHTWLIRHMSAMMKGRNFQLSCTMSKQQATWHPTWLQMHSKQWLRQRHARVKAQRIQHVLHVSRQISAASGSEQSLSFFTVKHEAAQEHSIRSTPCCQQAKDGGPVWGHACLPTSDKPHLSRSLGNNLVAGIRAGAGCTVQSRAPER